MYVPKAFQVSDSRVLADFIASNSFATLINSVQGSLFATHLPLILDRSRSSQGALLGHVARANRHWHAFDGQQEALAIFHGPHAYISPSWYASSSIIKGQGCPHSTIVAGQDTPNSVSLARERMLHWGAKRIR